MEILYFLSFFIISAVISFAGSVQLGPVNLGVIYTAVNIRTRSAIQMALGGCVPELFYSAAAFWLSDFLADYPKIIYTIHYIVPPLFIIAGIVVLLKKTAKKNPKESKSKYPFTSGLILGTLNPMLLPFWIFIIEYLKQYGIDPSSDIYSKLGFIAGTAFGAFLLLYLIVYFIKRGKKKFGDKFMLYGNKITGWLFILIGTLQLLRALLT